MIKINLVKRYKLFEGFLETYNHYSQSNKCEMIFSIFIPNKANKLNKVPSLYWLSGLTCTVDNFATKSGAFKYASKYGFIIIISDTSPRGRNIFDESEEDFFKEYRNNSSCFNNYDKIFNRLGIGASYYMKATQDPWSDNYNMYDYISLELPSLIENNFPVNGIKSIFGHSMGGYGALMIGLKNSNLFRSISAFAPVINPSPRVFYNYLGDLSDNNLIDKSKLKWLYYQYKPMIFDNYHEVNIDKWKQYDSIFCLNLAERKIPILIDLGSKDEFYPDYINPKLFIDKAKKLGFEIKFHLYNGYDHSYFFITSFIEKHFEFHAQYLI